MSKKGFTLIELLVVIAIIGMLAGIVLVSMGTARSRARDARRMSDMRQLISAQEMYMGDNEKYLQSGEADGGTWTNDYPSKIGSYLPATPQDPSYTAGLCPPPPGEFRYCGINNSTEPQKFCYYTRLERGGWYTASHGGNFETSTAPTTLDQCAGQ